MAKTAREQLIAEHKVRIARINVQIKALTDQSALEEKELDKLLNPILEPIKQSGNPPVNTWQPFHGNQAVIVEKRTPDGQLDFSAPQPPSNPTMTFNDLYELFFQEDKTAPGSWNALRAWLESKGWVVRAKTW